MTKLKNQCGDGLKKGIDAQGYDLLGNINKIICHKLFYGPND